MPENKERMTAEWNRHNTTIFSESELNLEDPKWFGVTVLLRMPPVANQDVVNRYLIQTAIAKKCRVMVEYRNIMKFHADYIVWTSSIAKTTEILKTKEIHIEGCTIFVYPWSPYSGSLMVQLDHTPPDCLMVTPTKRPRVNEILENLKVTGRGLPPHVCKCEVIKKVFANICHMHGMELHKEDISFTFRTCKPRIYTCYMECSRPQRYDVVHVATLDHCRRLCTRSPKCRVATGYEEQSGQVQPVPIPSGLPRARCKDFQRWRWRCRWTRQWRWTASSAIRLQC